MRVNVCVWASCLGLEADNCSFLPSRSLQSEDWGSGGLLLGQLGDFSESPHPSGLWFTLLKNGEGSRVWERGGGIAPRDLPSPLPTKRTRTYSATARASAGPVFKGVCKQFSRSQGHGFITPENGSEDIFVHVSDIEGEYVPVEGDEVTYKMCPIPPKNQKFQAVETHSVRSLPCLLVLLCPVLDLGVCYGLDPSF
ncbi:hypothetical protein STEG23_031767 [Scotinomys teguina]